jgi:hypothetical protein
VYTRMYAHMPAYAQQCLSNEPVRPPPRTLLRGLTYEGCSRESCGRERDGLEAGRGENACVSWQLPSQCGGTACCRPAGLGVSGLRGLAAGLGVSGLRGLAVSEGRGIVAAIPP